MRRCSHPAVSPNGPQDPGPTLLPNGVFQLNVRVTADLKSVVTGTRLGPKLKVVTASDKVMLSLCTKDRREARERYTIAHSALLGHFNPLSGLPTAPSLQKPVDVKIDSDGLPRAKATAEGLRTAIRLQEE